ncbi:GNAT family acetyltransferase [Robbsia sp. Bb-Pol-6]|uniref:GNAT family acetyltransferase n=1 Tax=Robbsia betulipollinis TaxID=2981849 RepID=A0ABT3ZJC7_9BURK|nr:GNAT family acetyltransferase [Robbsia betulipollinis]MCY0386644.1 GNAT family acetyltransferase [Robbsia betulipollinis]
MEIRPYANADQDAVIALWHACELVRPWNDPARDIARKLTEQPELFLVAIEGDARVGSIMAGFEGHRGWVNYLAVAPSHRGRGLGRRLMAEVETRLAERGCPKLNLQVRASNAAVIAFYRQLGYVQDDVLSFGRRLIEDAPSQVG